MLIFPILLISCTTEEEYKEIDAISKNSKTSKFKTLGPKTTEDKILPVNEINSLLATFYDESNFDAQSIVTVNQAIQSTGTVTAILVSGDINVTNSSIDKIREVISQSKGIFELSVEDSSMSLAAKNSLQNFIENVMLFSNGNYDSMINSIGLYESTIQANTTYTTADKDLILNTSLIAKTLLFYERKRKDKDWETSVGNKDDMFIVTDDLTFLMVRMALLAGNVQNNF